MSTRQGSWIWYELMTPDPAGAEAFYAKVIGWTMSGGDGGNPDYSFIRNSDGGMTGGVLRLSDDMRSHGALPCWLGYIGVDDCDAMVTAITGKGGRCLMPPRDIPMAGRIAMVADPDGAPFYVMTPRAPAGAAEVSTAFAPMTIGRCAWNELLAGNQSRALAFYTSLFGWSLPAPMDMGAMGTYQFVSHDQIMVGAIMQKPAEVPVPMWSHYFRVASIDAAVAAVVAHGGQIVNGPMEVPGHEYIIQAVDPQGAFFALVGQK